MTDTDIQRPGAAGRPQGDGTPLALAALLAGTLVGTISNNVVNVPLPAILEEFDAPLSSGVFVVVGFLLTFTATMPLVGWIGDRFGRRRVYCVALIGTAVCAVGAATAPSLQLLVAWRCLGGLLAAAFAPAVMGLLTWLFDGDRRGRAVGAWASVNGIGQAAGPAMGGFVADAWGWRWVFVPLVPVALAGLIGTLRHIPAYPGTRMRFDLTGACALTFGSGLLILGVALIPAPGTTAVVLALLGVLVAQVTWFQFDRLSSIPELRPFYEQGCEIAGCELKPLINVDAIQSRKLVVRTNPENRSQLVVDAVIINRAAFEQPFPAIALTFSNLNGDVVAQSVFTPDEYLAGDGRDLEAMPTDTPVRIVINIRDPGKDAVNYNIAFRAYQE